ncbi:MAG: AAA family ATPase [Rhodocyclaceae bacterium]|nr:AAA family ATPase [Rhodocyclaceae bacterium]
MKHKKLPIGIQTFAKIREADYYYVDKTGFALRLIDEGSHYFLSRPRRFGKSLFIDTLGELFAGNEALFQGLYCHDRWDWSVKYPVIRVNFAEGVLASRAALDQRIDEILFENAERLSLPLPEGSVAFRFGSLIRMAEQNTGQRVVILIDEYDKPILDNLTKPDIAREMRDGLRDFYSVIKGQDAHIRFVMLTGVSKFSKVSLFSGLNNLKDITVDARYSAICGYTEADLDAVFAPELEGLDREAIRNWYNGYNWTGEAVYNPFDALLLFDSREFRPYWFETGTPTFLIDLLTERQAWLPQLGQKLASEALLSAFEVGDLSTEALMFQAGYLTIDRVEDQFGERMYRLRYPNEEVQRSLNAALLLAWGSGGDAQIALRQRSRLGHLLLANDFAGMRELFTAFFASIPHDWHRKNPIAQYEGYYASVFYAYFAALGLSIVTEESSHAGRLDMAVRFNGQVYLFEFKVVEIEPEGNALAQIKARGYADRYRGSGEPVHLIGIEFSREQRSVVGFEVETL